MSQRTSPPNNTPGISLALLLALLTVFEPFAALLALKPALAQTPVPSFSPPAVVPKGTTIKVDGSSSMATINAALKKAYEEKYAGTSVTLAEDGSDGALKALIDGKVDLAAIGRALTPQEKQKGLVAAPIARHKIAIIVGSKNPFTGNITFEQFARLFRGEIKDWSELGGAPGAIRFVDRPTFSDTRQAFRPYPVFQKAPFKTGENTQQTAKDSTNEVVQALGTDGIGYAIADQVLDRKDVRIISMHKTLPDDPRYPFSQPLAYVYKGTPSPAVASFLGVATAPESQPLIEAARETGAETAAGASPVSVSPSATASVSPSASTGPSASTSPTDPSSPMASGAASPDVAAAPPGTDARGAFPWWLLLIPVLGALLWFWFKGRRTEPTPAVPPTVAAPPDRLPTPPTVAPPIVPPVPDASISDAPVAETSSMETPTTGVPAGNAAIAGGAALAAGAGAAGLAGLAGGTSAGNASAAEAEAAASAPSLETTPAIAPPATAPPSVDSPAIAPAASATNLSGSNGIPGAAVLAGGVLAAGAGAAALAGLAGNSDTARSNITLSPIDPTAGGEATPSHQQVAAAWEVPEEHKAALRQQGGRDLKLRLYDVTHIDLATQRPQSFQEFAVAEAAHNHITTIQANRDYVAEIGYLTSDRRWLALARSNQVRVTAPVAASVTAPARSQITLTPRSDYQAYAKWYTPDDHKAELRQHGGRNLVLRLYDVTGINLNQAQPQTFQEFPVTETASTYTTAIQPDRDYVAEIGFITEDGYWLLLARSNSVRIPSAANVAGAVVGGAALGAAGLTAAGLAATPLGNQAQTNVEAAKYNVGQADLSSEALASVDEGLPDLPEGYGDSRIVLMPRDPEWGYTYWDVPNDHKEELRRQGGQRLALRLYDVTDVELNHQSAHSLQQYDCDELARDWYVPIPVSDRDYIAEIGYLTGDGRWLVLARSNPVRIPPVYPSDWLEDRFISVAWDDDLRGTTLVELLSPAQQRAATTPDSSLYEQIFGMAQSTEALRVAGSLFGSMQHIAGSMQQIPSQAVSSYVFPSGISLAGVPGVPGFPGVPTFSGLTMSGIGMSGIGLGAMPPLRARKFWLVADAELIVYGATEPDATVTIDGRPIQLNPDGTFRFHLSFQDGVINFPIIAVAADGEQTRSIHMTFERETPFRKTNAKDEAVDELF